MMNDEIQKSREKLLNLLKELRIPDPAKIKELIQKSELSYTELKKFNLDDHSTLDLLERAEMIAQLLWFATDTKRMQKTLAQDLNITLYSSVIEKSTKEFLRELERLDAKTSASFERDFDLPKEYNIMQGFPKLTLANPKKLKENYIYFFEAMMYKYILPITRKLKTTKKEKYISSGMAIKNINEKTDYKFKELLGVIDISLRNAVAHQSFVYDETEDCYEYTQDKTKKSIKLSYKEFHQKIGKLFVLYSCLMNEIDGYLIVEAIRTIIHFVVEREFQKYNLPNHLWKRCYTLTKKCHFEELSYLCGLHVTGELYYSKEINKMKLFFHQLLEDHTSLRNHLQYIQYSFDFISSFMWSEKGLILEESDRFAIKSLFFILHGYIQNLSQKSEEEMSYWMKCSQLLTKL